MRSIISQQTTTITEYSEVGTQLPPECTIRYGRGATLAYKVSQCYQTFIFFQSKTALIHRIVFSVAGGGRFAISLLGNPRFSQSFLHGETNVSPTPFLFDSNPKTQNTY